MRSSCTSKPWNGSPKTQALFLGHRPNSTLWPYLKERRTLQWGGMSDPFCTYEQKHGHGLALLRFFREIDYPICFSTKGTWWTKDERYMSLFRGNKNWNVKVSIVTGDEAKAKEIEKGVPTVAERLRAIERIAKSGCDGATLRLRPFMIGISNPGHEQLIRDAGAAGAGAVSTEFFCLELRSRWMREHGLPVFSRLSGLDYAAFYRQNSEGAGYLRLGRAVKLPFMYQMQAAATQAGMRFYSSDAHTKDFSCGGSCCGLGEHFNYSRGQFSQAMFLAKTNGSVRWSEIASDMAHLEWPWVKAEGHNRGSTEKAAQFHFHTMKEYLRWLWNNTKAANSPAVYFAGVLKPDGLDSDENVVYRYCGTPPVVGSSPEAFAQSAAPAKKGG